MVPVMYIAEYTLKTGIERLQWSLDSIGSGASGWVDSMDPRYEIEMTPCSLAARVDTDKHIAGRPLLGDGRQGI